MSRIHKLMLTESEKDLGVVIHSTLKPAAHIANCVKKANQMLGMIQRTITYKNKRILLLMYKSLVRPHLEYAVQAWSPHQLGHIRLIEGVQRRFTRMIPELKSLTYEARLKRLNLTTLEIRRIRGDRTVIFDKFEIFMGNFFLGKLCAKYNNTSYMIMPLCQKRFKYNYFNVFVTEFNMIKSIKQKKIN